MFPIYNAAGCDKLRLLVVSVLVQMVVYIGTRCKPRVLYKTVKSRIVTLAYAVAVLTMRKLI